MPGDRELQALPHADGAGEEGRRHAGVDGDEEIVGQAVRQFPEEQFGIDRVGRQMGALLLVRPPVGRGALDLGAPLVAAARFQARQQRAQGERRVADQRRLHRIAQRQHRGVDVDLHAARGAFLGQELAIGEGRAHHQQRVAALHQLVGGLGAQKADLARHEGQAVGQHALAQKRLGDARLQALGHRHDFRGGVGGAGADQHRHPLAAVQDIGGAVEVVLAGNDPGPAHAHAGVDRAVGVPRLDRLGLLHVVGKDHHGHAALGLGDAHRPVDQMPRLLGRRADLDELRDVLHQRGEVDFLLVMAAQRGARLLAHDRHHRLAVELGVVQSVQQMDGARPGGRQAHADLAGEAGVAAGHEGCFLLVADLHEVERILHAAQRRQQAVDAIARIAEQAAHAPLAEPLEDEIADGLGHGRSPNRRSRRSPAGSRR